MTKGPDGDKNRTLLFGHRSGFADEYWLPVSWFLKPKYLLDCWSIFLQNFFFVFGSVTMKRWECQSDHAAMKKANYQEVWKSQAGSLRHLRWIEKSFIFISDRPDSWISMHIVKTQDVHTRFRLQAQYVSSWNGCEHYPRVTRKKGRGHVTSTIVDIIFLI